MKLAAVRHTGNQQQATKPTMNQLAQSHATTRPTHPQFAVPARARTLGMAVSRSAIMRSAFLASASASDSVARASRSASWLAASSCSAAWSWVKGLRGEGAWATRQGCLWACLYAEHVHPTMQICNRQGRRNQPTCSSAWAARGSTDLGAPLPMSMRPPRGLPPPPDIVPLSLIISP